MNSGLDWNDIEHNFRERLISEEKSRATVEKYVRDIHVFLDFLGERPVSKIETISYKKYMTERYAPASVNSMIASLNSFMKFIGREECAVRTLKIQRQTFRSEEKELTKHEMQQLVKAAGNTRLSLVIRTICGTGIRVSELRYITSEAVKEGRAFIHCKNKTRVILIPQAVKKILALYIRKEAISSGPVFITKSGKPLDRRNIWRDMKSLCKKAGVSPHKVFPHNLRHLFARTFYRAEKDIVKLADLLGHSNINTTRVYTAETGSEHMMRLERVEKILIT